MAQKSVDSLNKIDILVVGGGIAGLMAAMAAKDKNNTVLIVEATNVLGGQGTSGGVAGFCGDTRRVNDIFKELIGKLSGYNLIENYAPNADRRSYDLEWCAFFLQEMIRSREIDVLLHSRVIDAVAVDGLIGQVQISTAAGTFLCQPRFVVDASGINTISVCAGFPVINEGANKQLPMSLYFTLWDTGKKVKPILPAGCPHWSNDDEIPMTSLHFFPSGKVEVKMKIVGFDGADGYSLSQAEQFARRQMIGLIYYLQTHGYKDRILDTYTLASVSRAVGLREQRRIIGEHILNFEEIKHASVFKDAVAVGTYHTDYHWPDKMQRAGTGIITMLEPYHIPLASLIPKNARNLIVPGRGASAEQMVLSSFRVMATVAQMGYAAGKAAKQSVAQNITIEKIDISGLQSEIEAGGQSLDLSSYGEYLREMLFFHEDVFKQNSSFKTCHAATIVQAKNNRFLVAWFAGTKEGNQDNGIWLCDRYQTSWSNPRLVAKINKEPHWNPVLFRAPDKTIRLFFKVGPNPSNWQTWQILSTDEGINWSDPVPLENHSPHKAAGPVKNKPIVLSDGSWLAPNSMETEEKWDAFADISTDSGKTWQPSNLVPVKHASFDGKGVIQPALWQSGVNDVHMLLRSTCGKICRSDSTDMGRTWSPARTISLPNNNSGIDIARLKNGILALVFNPVSVNWGARSPLTIALSEDNGKTWPHKLNIETGKGEFSYPSVIPTETGMAVVYTYKRKKIKFWHGSIERILSGYDPDRLKYEICHGVKNIKTKREIL